MNLLSESLPSGFPQILSQLPWNGKWLSDVQKCLGQETGLVSVLQTFYMEIADKLFVPSLCQGVCSQT